MQKEKKTEIITLRVTPQTKDRIRAKAQELGLTVTDYLCLCGLGKRIVRVDVYKRQSLMRSRRMPQSTTYTGDLFGIKTTSCISTIQNLLLIWLMNIGCF